jgi:hypothetical protein
MPEDPANPEAKKSALEQALAALRNAEQQAGVARQRLEDAQAEYRNAEGLIRQNQDCFNQGWQDASRAESLLQSCGGQP